MSNSTFFATICEPYIIGPFGGSFLTICFIDLLLPIVSFLVLFTFGISRAYKIRNFPNRVSPLSLYQKVTLFLSCCTILLPLINIIYNGSRVKSLPWFSYIQLIFEFINWLVATIFVELEYRKGLKNGWPVIIFWLISSVLGVFRIQSYADYKKDKTDNLIFVIIECIFPILLSMNAFLFNTSSKEKSDIENLAKNDIKFNHLEDGYSEEEDNIGLDEGQSTSYQHLNSDENSIYGSIIEKNEISLNKSHYSPEQEASFFSKMFFTWLNPTLNVGYYRPLSVTDLPQLNIEDECFVSEENFQTYWLAELQANKENPSLIKTICRSQISLFCLSGVLFIANAILTFVPSLLLLEIFNYLGDPSRPLYHGALLSFGLLFSKIFEGLTAQNSYWIMDRASIRVEQALSSLIYKKVLKKRINLKEGDESIGEILNLQSVDAEVLKEFVCLFNDAWAIPFQIVGALVGVGVLLGSAVFGAILTLLIIMPISAFFWYLDFQYHKEVMEIKDSRATQLNEIIQGITIIKFFTWEQKFIKTIEEIRSRELWVILKLLFFQGTSMVFWGSMQFFLSFSVFLIFTARGEILTPDKAFVTISLLNIMMLPLIILPYFIGLAVSASVSSSRIIKFLISEELDQNEIEHQLGGKPGIQIKNASFSWNENVEKPILEDINLTVNGSLVALVGEVGTGKSSFLVALLGEMKKKSGSVIVNGSVAYVNQQGWLLNDTLKNNILFGKNFDQKRYIKTLKMCELKQDIDILPAGDETEIGEKGINLSGGQKLRVSLARAVYSDADIFLLDDPLSALDAHVGKNIFENCLCKYLAKKTILLVTHQLQHLSKCDEILLLEHGKIIESGNFQTLSRNENSKVVALINKHTIAEVNAEEEIESKKEIFFKMSKSSGSDLKNSIVEDMKRSLTGSDADVITPLHSSSLKASQFDDDDDDNKGGKDGKLISAEGKESGKLKLALIWDYLNKLGLLNLVFLFFLYILKSGADGMSDVWLTYWTNQMQRNITNGTLELTSQIDSFENIAYSMSSSPETNIPSSWFFFGIYSSLGFSSTILAFCINMTLLYVITAGSRMLHASMLDTILHQPMSFFDTTPTGRILNRFGADQKHVDIDLCWNASNISRQTSQLLVVIVIIGYVNPIFLVMLLPLSFFYKNVQSIYRGSRRELMRLKGISKSPILSLFQESFSGLSIIRSFERENDFSRRLQDNVNKYSVPLLAITAADRWFAIRLDIIGAFIVFFSTFFSLVLFRNSVESGFVGLSITYALTISGELNWLTRNLAEAEGTFISVERIMEYSKLTREAPMQLLHRPPHIWPSKGKIELINIKMRYRPGLPLVLDDVSLDIEPGHKVGICGRTGAGKSSLMLALFRMIELEEGSIVIDGEDIAKIGLGDLRRNLSIIPQNPTLFAGTIRYNIDPFHEYSDEAIWVALDSTHLTQQIKLMEGQLEAKVTEYGNNLSVGTKQLLCLARALLRKSKILIMDEATANVDYETDGYIQQAIQEGFKNSTVLTIAHRINTILNYDRVLVLKQGKAVEYQSPSVLLEDSSTIFYSLASEAGLV